MASSSTTSTTRRDRKEKGLCWLAVLLTLRFAACLVSGGSRYFIQTITPAPERLNGIHKTLGVDFSAQPADKNFDDIAIAIRVLFIDMLG
jgi:hypothetical protein